MATKKHNLTTHKDTITGKSGSDLFIGTKGELGSDDVLNGGGGIDTISATVSGKHLAPVMKNIENGVFTHVGNKKLGLDLADADKMTSVTLKDLHADAVLKNAASLTDFSLSNVDQHNVMISGVDIEKSLTQKLSFTNVSQSSIDFQTLSSLQPHTIDVTLRNGDVGLNGDISVVELAIHSNGKRQNTLNIHTDASFESAQKITVDGSADLNFLYSQTDAFDSVKIFDASAMRGRLITQLESDKLTDFRGGFGNDELFVQTIGGTQGQKASVNTGAGADELYINQLVFDGSKMVLNGGKGVDTVSYNGTDSGIAAGFKNFEILEIESAEGTYNLGAGWKTLRIVGHQNASDPVVFKGGTNLTLVQGTTENDNIELYDLGGTTGHKAQVKLGLDDDVIHTEHLALNTATQRIDGGKGHDGLVISGNVADVGAIFKHFEYAYMYNMSGTYDFSGSGVDGIVFGSAPSAAMTLNGLASGSLIQLLTTQTTITTVNINGAAASDVESFTVDLTGTSDFGNSSFGLITPHLSELTIASREGAHTMYITQLGDSSDFATLNITGETMLTLAASNGSTSYIDEIHITNTAGVDMLGLLEGTKALASGGVHIAGGSGADVLVGGAGADTIIAGGGDDKVYGSLGIDNVDLTDGGFDMLIFRNKGESAYNSGDNITGFNIFAGIDISDLVSSVSFGGNVANNNAGSSTLSTNHAVGFFNTSNHTLYVDINHDGTLTSGEDMEFHLTGLNSFTSSSLIG